MWSRVAIVLLALCGIWTAGNAQDTIIGGGIYGMRKPAGGAVNCASVVSSLGANLVGCWDADAGVSRSGSNVLTWTDQSSNAYVLGLNTVLGEPAPTSPVFNASSYNGKAGITCTAANAMYLATTTSVAFGSVSTASFFIAAKITPSIAAYGRIISTASSGHNDSDNTTSAAAVLRNSSNQEVTFFWSSSGGTAYSIVYNTESRLGTIFDGSSGGVTYLNNVLQATTLGVTPVFGTNNISLCDGAGSGTALMDGTVRRAVVTNNAASSANRTVIDAFLSN